MKPLILVCLFFITAAVQAQNVVPLWQDGAPGFERLKDKPEKAKDWWVKSIHYPTMTAFLPDPDKATGAAVLIFPGGGHRELVFEAEGVDAATFLRDMGVAAFVLKYRLGRELLSPYSVPEHPKQDAQRAMRIIRENASDWGIDVERVGVMGFSAGGEVAAFIAYESGEGDSKSADPIERQNSKPNFQILVYPGPGGIPNAIPKDAPPVFMIASIDDPCCIKPVIHLLGQYELAKIPAEAHVFSRGGHGYNMGQRETDRRLANWPERLKDWLLDTGIAIKP